MMNKRSSAKEDRKGAGAIHTRLWCALLPFSTFSTMLYNIKQDLCSYNMTMPDSHPPTALPYPPAFSILNTLFLSIISYILSLFHGCPVTMALGVAIAV
jgi:hypothetical protein